MAGGDWLTEEQAAKHIGKARRTLQFWRRYGYIEGYGHGPHRTMYRIDDLESVAAERRQAYEDRPKPGRPRQGD